MKKMKKRKLTKNDHSYHWSLDNGKTNCHSQHLRFLNLFWIFLSSNVAKSHSRKCRLLPLPSVVMLLSLLHRLGGDGTPFLFFPGWSLLRGPNVHHQDHGEMTVTSLKRTHLKTYLTVALSDRTWPYERKTYLTVPSHMNLRHIWPNLAIWT